MRWRLARICLLVVALFVVTGGPAQAAPRRAPAFSLELFGGKTLSLESLRGRAVVLLFWAPW